MRFHPQWRIASSCLAVVLASCGSPSPTTHAPPPPCWTPTLPGSPPDSAPFAKSNSQITLSWMASTDNVGVTGYLVERCAGTACANFSQISQTASTMLERQRAHRGGGLLLSCPRDGCRRQPERLLGRRHGEHAGRGGCHAAHRARQRASHRVFRQRRSTSSGPLRRTTWPSPNISSSVARARVAPVSCKSPPRRPSTTAIPASPRRRRIPTASAQPMPPAISAATHRRPRPPRPTPRRRQPPAMRWRRPSRPPRSTSPGRPRRTTWG